MCAKMPFFVPIFAHAPRAAPTAEADPVLDLVVVWWYGVSNGVEPRLCGLGGEFSRVWGRVLKLLKNSPTPSLA